jgi:hypothetical protein
MIAVEVSTPVCLLNNFTHPFTGEIIIPSKTEIDSDTVEAITIINCFAQEYPTDEMWNALSDAIYDFHNGNSLDADEILSLWFTYSEIEIIESRSEKLYQLATAVS